MFKTEAGMELVLLSLVTIQDFSSVFFDINEINFLAFFSVPIYPPPHHGSFKNFAPNKRLSPGFLPVKSRRDSSFLVH